MDYIQPAIGFFVLLLLGAAFSENIKAIKIRYVISAIVIQVLLALMLIKLPLVTTFFASSQRVQSCFVRISMTIVAGI